MLDKKKLDGLYVRISMLEALMAMRALGRDNFEKFKHRLYLAVFKNKHNDVNTVPKKKLRRGSLRGILFKAKRKAYGIYHFLRLFSTYYRQSRVLFGGMFENLLVIASSSKRVPLMSNECVRSQLVDLYKPMGCIVLPHTISEKILSSAPILLSDPELFSNYWRLGDLQKSGKVFIVDGGFLLFAQLYLFIFMKGMMPLDFLKIRKVYHKLNSDKPKYMSFSRFVKFYIFDSSYSAIFDSCKKVSAIFMTSNSILTEQLRSNLLCNEKCSFLVEMLHGIPSKEFVAYYSEILSLIEGSASSQKQMFIPLLPQPRLPQEMRKHLFGNNKLAINAYFNQYLLFLKNQNKTLLSNINKLINCGFWERGNTSPLIITFLGGTNFSGVFAESPMFKIEMEIIKQILNKASRTNIDIVILYSFHPAHNNDDFSELKIFRENRILLVENTIPTWFISHGAVSLYSSALFEMAFLGIKPLSFMVKDDNLFTDEQLAAITSNTSRNTTDVNVRIEEFIDELLATEFSSMDVQIQERSKKLGVDMGEFVASSNLEKSKGEIFCT